MQVINLIDYFRTLATLHTNIESFGTGDLFEVAIAGEDLYTQLWLEQVFQNITTNGRSSWSVAFIIHAIQKHDESDEDALLDSTFLIGQQVIEKIKQDAVYVLGDSINTVSFTERFEDFTCGWRFEITLTEALAVDRCDINSVFPSGCNYQGIISHETDDFFNGITTDVGPLVLPSFPLSLKTLDFLPLPDYETIIIADMALLGYVVTVDQSVFTDKGQFNITLDITVIDTETVFVSLDGDNTTIPFTSDC